MQSMQETCGSWLLLNLPIVQYKSSLNLFWLNFYIAKIVLLNLLRQVVISTPRPAPPNQQVTCFQWNLPKLQLSMGKLHVLSEKCIQNTLKMRNLACHLIYEPLKI